MSHTVIITRRAAGEVRERFHSLASRSRVSASRWQANLLKVIESLKHNPVRCPIAPESAWYGDGLRETYFGKRLHIYRVLFEVRGTTVFILRVRHGRQDLLNPDDLRRPEA